MNPLVITGILAVVIASAYLMISFSTEQVRYSGVIEQTSTMQTERLREEAVLSIQDGQLLLENTGSVPIQIREIRLLDNDGRIILRQETDRRILSAQTLDMTDMVEPRFLEQAGP